VSSIEGSSRSRKATLAGHRAESGRIPQSDPEAGAGRGLGLNICRGLLEAGAEVAGIDLWDESPADFANLATHGKVRYYR
jgi:hypothetical protein